MTFLPDDVVTHLRASGDALDLSGTKYRLRGTVGEGGMGAVYVVEDVELGREVALKVVPDADAGALAERLAKEARFIARLEHPGIVPVHDIGQLGDGRWFYVMKLVRGERLDRWARERSLHSVLRMFQRVCEAVAFAHARGVIHRDLKPDNVMVGPFGEALVMDWGLAKQLDDEPDASIDEPPRADATDGLAVADTLPAEREATEGSSARDASGEARTAAGAVMGTPAFMAPEQARGEIDALDRRTDVYGLGAMLYALLAKRPPFDGRSAREVLSQVIASEPPSLREARPDLPRPVASICARAMAKAPEDRYASALELAEDVGAFLEQAPVSAHRETLVEKVTRFVSRHRVLLTLLAVYLLVRVAMAIFVPG